MWQISKIWIFYRLDEELGKTTDSHQEPQTMEVCNCMLYAISACIDRSCCMLHTSNFCKTSAVVQCWYFTYKNQHRYKNTNNQHNLLVTISLGSIFCCRQRNQYAGRVRRLIHRTLDSISQNPLLLPVQSRAHQKTVQIWIQMTAIRGLILLLYTSNIRLDLIVTNLRAQWLMIMVTGWLTPPQIFTNYTVNRSLY